MGNKINPTNFRIAKRLNWKNLWNAPNTNYAEIYKNSIDLVEYTKVLAKCLGYSLDLMTVIKGYKKDYRMYSSLISLNTVLSEHKVKLRNQLQTLDRLNVNQTNSKVCLDLFKPSLEGDTHCRQQNYPILSGQFLSDFIANNINSKGRYKNTTFRKRSLQKNISIIVYNMIKNWNIRNICGIRIVVSGRWQRTKSGRKQKLIVNFGELKKSSVATVLSYGFSSAITKYGSNGVKVYVRYAKID